MPFRYRVPEAIESPIVNMMEYGTAVYSAREGSRTVQGIPAHLRRLDHLVATLPDGQRKLCELRYVLGLSYGKIASQCRTTPSRILRGLTKVHQRIDATWTRATW